jgi:hypothetical protein
MSRMFAACLAAAAITVTGCQNDGSTEPTTGSPAPGQWTMPDLVGSSLQDAQDRIQTLTGGQLLITGSHDATGQDRSQVFDDNWKVCTQNVAPGSPITTDTRIDFGAVRTEEQCPG